MNITRSVFATIIFLFVSILNSCTEKKPGAEELIESFLTEKNHFQSTSDVWGNYTLALTIESIINYSILSQNNAFIPAVESFFNHRGYSFEDTIDYRTIPFADPFYAYYKFKQDESFTEAFLYQAREMKNTVARSAEGAVCITHEDQEALLIDYIQDYASRMARAGRLSQDPAFFEECVSQFEIYRKLLRYDDTGLYSQGRGWLADSLELSPSCWSRGQGWLIRGMVESMICLPENSGYYKRLQPILKEFADALISVQDEQGMWHTLPCMDPSKSEAEVSGTAFISYYLSVAVQQGILKGNTYRAAAQKALAGLKNYIDQEGNIHQISKGPGTLRTVDPYYKAGEKNDHHGLPAVILALSMDGKI